MWPEPFLASGQGPEFNLNIRIENTDMTPLNPLLRAYGRFDVAQGRFTLYSQPGAKDGNMVEKELASAVDERAVDDGRLGRLHLWTSQILPADQLGQAKQMLIGTAAHILKEVVSVNTASSLGSDAWVLVRRRNSSLMRSSALVVRSAFHCEEGKAVKVKSSSPASSKLALTALQRSFHLRRKPTHAWSTASRLGA